MDSFVPQFGTRRVYEVSPWKTSKVSVTREPPSSDFLELGENRNLIFESI